MFHRPQRKDLSGILAEGELDFELYFATEVLKMDSLHYGYWDDPPESLRLDLDVMSEAQARYTERLLEFVPESADRVLDVGAGVGDNARALAARGHRVHAISPDRNHAGYFREAGDRIEFEASRFEDFRSPEWYDLILFSESHNYINHQVALEQCRRYLRPDGQIVVSGMFRMPDRGPFPDGYAIEDHPYLELARDFGFVVDELVDITPNVKPTMAMIHGAYQDHLAPLIDVLGKYLKTIAPLKARLLELAIAPQLDKFEEVRDYYLERCDPEYMESHIRYLTVRMSRERS